MKLSLRTEQIFRSASLPSRGAWIEMRTVGLAVRITCSSLPSRGAWIEIAQSRYCVRLGARRSPRGERGLKLPNRATVCGWARVAPLAGSVD